MFKKQNVKELAAYKYITKYMHISIGKEGYFVN